jgi:hypothetical protein
MTIKKSAEKTRWHRRTAVQLQHPTKSLFFGHQTAYLYFCLAREVEEWFEFCVTGHCRFHVRALQQAQLSSPAVSTALSLSLSVSVSSSI